MKPGVSKQSIHAFLTQELSEPASCTLSTISGEFFREATISKQFHVPGRVLKKCPFNDEIFLAKKPPGSPSTRRRRKSVDVFDRNN